MELSVKVVNAGKCMICGKPIKLVVHNYSKLPNIFFCSKCEKQRVKENKSQKESEVVKMDDNIFEKLTDEEQEHLWMYMIFNRDKIIEKTEELTKEAEEAGMTLTEYLEFINPLNCKRKDNQ